MVKAVRIQKPGPADVLVYEDITVPPPGAVEARIAHKAIGINFIDVYHRTGIYPQASYPAGIGMEGAGIVEAIGAGVTEVKVGDRVAYASPPPGSYAEARNLKAAALVKLPAEIPFEQAAGMMLQGMTAEYLLRRTYQVKPGDTILVHAAAGGVGLILCQWAKHIGATVIGTVSSEAKAELARAHGCHHPIIYTKENFVERVKEITNGKLLPVVYDSIGKDTLMKSIECLRTRGLLVSFGQASGKLENFDTASLAPRSLYMTRPGLFNYVDTRPELEESANALFEVVHSGKVRIEIHHKYALKDARQAHIELESRKTTGGHILIP
ncbi:MAG: quinone oxidoreductase [Alphaproteobacteria bacterium]|nr:quinone oxidoreductase [Alphaproteobacteria bacterium]